MSECMHECEVLALDLQLEWCRKLDEDANSTEPRTARLCVTFNARLMDASDNVPARKRVDSAVPHYAPPQPALGRVSSTADIWAAGIVLFTLLSGHTPFEDSTDEGVRAKVRLGNYCFAKTDWKHVTERAKQLIRVALKLNPADRITAERALQHAWLALGDRPTSDPRR